MGNKLVKGGLTKWKGPWGRLTDAKKIVVKFLTSNHEKKNFEDELK